MAEDNARALPRATGQQPGPRARPSTARPSEDHVLRASTKNRPEPDPLPEDPPADTGGEDASAAPTPEPERTDQPSPDVGWRGDGEPPTGPMTPRAAHEQVPGPQGPQGPPGPTRGREHAVAPAFRDFLSVLRRYRWSVLLATLSTLGVALLFSFAETPMYRADAALLVRPIGTGAQEGAVNMITEEEVIQSNVIGDRAAALLGGDVAGSALVVGLDASAVEDTEVLEISYTADSREKARERTEAFVQAYLDHRQEQRDRAVEQVRAAIQEELDALDQSLTEVRAELANAPEAEQGELQAQVNQISGRIVERRLALTEARATGAVSEVLRSAAVEPGAVSPDLIMDGIIGLVLGLLLGLSTAVLRDQLDDRVRDLADVSRVLDTPAAFSVPRHRTLAPYDDVLAARSSLPDKALEAYRALAIDVATTMRHTGHRSLLVTGAHRGAGASTLAIQLAITLARSGRLVLLVSADIRDPSVEEQLGVRGAPGLVDVLERRVGPADAVMRTSIPRLYVMPAGSDELRAPELLASQRMELIVPLLEDAADIVLYDTPPVGERADALAAAGAVGRALVVAGTDVTRPVLDYTARQLRQVGAEIVGGVITGTDSSWLPGAPRS